MLKDVDVIQLCQHKALQLENRNQHQSLKKGYFKVIPRKKIEGHYTMLGLKGDIKV